MEASPIISILIVNYNGKHFLKECFDSIKAHVKCSYEIILVDNASSDGSVDYIKEHYPEVVLIASKENTGFTGGNNLGAQYAKGNLLLLLNNDTVLLNDIQPAISCFDDANVGALGCKLVYGDQSMQPSFGHDHRPLRLILFWSGLGDLFKFLSISKLAETDPVAYESEHGDIGWVCGAFLLTRTSLWHKLHGLDDTYFMYVEDVDYCKRVINSGFNVVYTSKVKIIHYGGGGKAWLGRRALHNTIRSYLIYTSKFYNPLSVMLLRVGLSIVLSVRAITYYVASIMNRNHDVNAEKATAFISGVLILLKKL